MTAVKLGYVVVYPNPPHCKGLDEFLVIDSTGATLKMRTDANIEKATVFETEAAARHYASFDPPNGRNADVRAVEQVTLRRLAHLPAAASLKDFMEKVQRTVRDPRAPFPRDGVMVQPLNAPVPMAAVGVPVGAEPVPGKVETFPRASKLGIEINIVPDGTTQG
jgi:hypothetical protein